MSKKFLLISTVCVALLMLVLGDLDAIGGRGGRGGRGGGGGRVGGGRGGSMGGGRHVSRGGGYARTPSMSRAVNRPQAGNRPQVGNRPYAGQRPAPGRPAGSRGNVQRPTSGQMQQFLGNRNQVNPGFKNFDRSQARSQIQQRIQQGNIQGRGATVDSALPGRGQQGNFASRIQNNRNNANNIRDRIQDRRPDSRNWFNNDFWRDHGYYPYQHYHDVDWWRGAGWAALAAWIPYHWDSPIYYDSCYPIYVDSSYVDSTVNPFPESQTTTVVQPSAAVPAASQPAAPSQGSGDWLSLGVFALAQSAEVAPNTNSFLQLALNKNGSIAGTYYNSSTDGTYPIEGMVDQTSQKVVIKLSSNPSSPVLETGIFNLTQEIAPIQMIFSDGSVQNWILVRLNQ